MHKLHSYVYHLLSPVCEKDEFQCPNDSRCIPLAYRCDDIVDCDDGSDEQRCSKSENELNVHACIFFEWQPWILETRVQLYVVVYLVWLCMYGYYYVGKGAKAMHWMVYTIIVKVKLLLFYSVVLSSPSVMTVEEGASGGLPFCLTVTEYPDIIHREYLVESFPIGSAKSKTTMVSVRG